jgi:drug efflux transport system ATP-binding protein
MSEMCVDVQGLSKSFGDFKAVDSVDFQIRKGSIFGFLGSNGAGKSTTIRMLLGILTPTSGRGVVLGHDILTESAKIRAVVGYMAQRFSLYEDLTPLENLRFFAGMYGLVGKRLLTRMDEVMDLARLREYRNTLTRSLPGGVRQRLALAVALLHQPELIFLDEPTGNVDPALRRHFWEVIAGLSHSGKTVMVTSHYMDEVERCDKICFIQAGRLIGQGSPRELKSSVIKIPVFSLSTQRRREALKALRGIDGVQSPFPAGSTVRFLFGGNPHDLNAALEGHGFASEQLKLARANLEDVFIYLATEVSA